MRAAEADGGESGDVATCFDWLTGFLSNNEKPCRNTIKNNNTFRTESFFVAGD